MSARADQSAWQWAVLIVLAITLTRLLVVWSTGLNLGPDEAQYWAWSKELDSGYFSKPPMIAWIIAAFTGMCGDGEGCVRTASPLLYGVASLFVFATARVLYDARMAFWSCVAFVTLPGVSFSSALMTTDVPLLTLWAAALYCLALMLRRTPGEARLVATLLGAAIGLSMLAKYAGAYFFLGLIVASLFDRRVRAHMLGLNGVILVAAALAVFSPNILWNLEHQFATVSHTAFNAGLQGKLFNIGRLFEFAGAQFALFGPILMGAIVAGLAMRLRNSRWTRAANDDVVLLSISVPVILAGLGIAFLSKANANWSAPAYVGLSIVAVAWLTRGPTLRWLQASTAIAVVLGAGLYAAALSPRFVEAIGQTNAFKLLRAWEVQGPAIARAAREGAYDAILAEDREDMASMLYYTRDSGVPIRMWTPDAAHPTDHFQMTRGYTGEPARVLFVTRRDEASDVTGHFANAKEVEVSSAIIGKDRKRVFRLIALDEPMLKR